MNKQNIKPKNPYRYLFIVFLVLMVVFCISPLLIKINFINRCIGEFISNLGNYKEVYISSLGAALGTGLAVSSALYLQKKDSLNNKIDEIHKERINENNATENIINWINRELNMLWGLWVWSTYDISYNGITILDEFKGHLYFEPYEVDSNLIFENYTKINKYLLKEDKDIFLKLYYFAEKINKYINSYNKLNYDISMITSNPASFSGNCPDIYSELKRNTSSEHYKTIFKYLLSNEENSLFFSNEIEKNDCDTYFNNFVNCKREKEKKINEAIQIYMSKTEEGELNYAKANSYVESYIKSQQTEDKYGIDCLIKQILDIDFQVKKLSQEYKLNRNKHYKSVDNQIAIGNEITKLIVSLNSILQY
jgi:hypothetical protein